MANGNVTAPARHKGQVRAAGQTRPMNLHPALVARLAALAPDQRAAATAPPGPILCIAPAGSGKTTTLVARISWLVGSGVAPDEIAAITFNRRAATSSSPDWQQP